MIGVIAKPNDHAVVREFFELFKTPWEFHRSDRRYDVLLCADDTHFNKNSAKMAVIYGGQKLELDFEEKIEIESVSKRGGNLSYERTTIPLYGECITFRREGANVLEQGSAQPVIHQRRSGDTVVTRIGYDLFSEVRFLLTKGQPVANAAMPALDLHIGLLRDLIVTNGILLAEIPPVPDGYRFIACLTHDVDHPLLRQHRFDHTMFGFLYRATVGSVVDVIQGRAPFRNLVANWMAALKLPLVHLGVAKDFWQQFDGYVKLEKGIRSTFFVIPFKRRPGRTESGSAPRIRASGYGADDIAGHLSALSQEGCEIGLHGIDAWIDSSKGSEEVGEIRRLTGSQGIGSRMHWLYFRESSPRTLEEAGVDYDSTVGYNATIGYRAGTTQAYKPLDTVRLLELPLHIMDTALFFPGHLHLTAEAASKLVNAVIENAIKFGGVVTVNWHDRSIAPERLWGDFYLQLIDELKSKGAWIVTAAEAVSWFRKRRSATFENGSWATGARGGKIAGEPGGPLPGLLLRTYGLGEVPQDTLVSSAMPELARPLADSK